MWGEKNVIKEILKRDEIIFMYFLTWVLGRRVIYLSIYLFNCPPILLIIYVSSSNDWR